MTALGYLGWSVLALVIAAALFRAWMEKRRIDRQLDERDSGAGA